MEITVCVLRDDWADVNIRVVEDRSALSFGFALLSFYHFPSKYEGSFVHRVQ